MKATIEEVIDGATPGRLFDQVSTLDAYPSWMRLVHRVTPLDEDGGRPAWWVELRAKVGPLARSKQLRMVRTAFEPGRLARFQRIQIDDRDHADWILTAVVGGRVEAAPEQPAGTRLTMDLEYTGELWSASLLGRILDDEVRRGTEALSGMFRTSHPTR